METEVAGMRGDGIPENMFGPVPEAFYGSVGRVVMMAAMLEVRLLDLLTELDRSTQDRYAGEQASALIKQCRALLPRYDAKFAASARGVLDQTATALEQRNFVVHSVWPSPGLAEAFGWRPVRKAQRPSSGQPYLGTRVDLTWLRALIDRLVLLVAEVDGLRGRAASTRQPAPP